MLIFWYLASGCSWEASVTTLWTTRPALSRSSSPMTADLITKMTECAAVIRGWLACWRTCASFQLAETCWTRQFYCNNRQMTFWRTWTSNSSVFLINWTPEPCTCFCMSDVYSFEGLKIWVIILLCFCCAMRCLCLNIIHIIFWFRKSKYRVLKIRTYKREAYQLSKIYDRCLGKCHYECINMPCKS